MSFPLGVCREALIDPGQGSDIGMLKRLRSTGMAGGGAMLLVLALSGVVAAATVLTALTAPVVDPTVPPVVVAATTFVDADGNGVDDSCQTGVVVADPVAAASAEVAADLNGDGQISVTEAARSGRTGGKNCNHGGYVSSVAHADQTCGAPAPADTTQPADTTDSADTTQQGDANDQGDEADSGDANTGETKTGDEVDTAATTTTDTTTCTETQTTDTTVPVVCPQAPVTTTPATTTDTTVPTVDLGPNAHGKAVSKVAHSTDVGGKNCNHGGAVSAAAHDTAARDAAKAARDAARAAKHLNKQHGKHHNG
jgi:hypothetical protein